MNKIEELLAQLCPNGVEFKELGEVVKVLRGRRLTRNQLTPDEKYPVFHGGLEPLGYYGQSNRTANTVMVINVGASAGTVGFSSVDFWSSDGCFCISHSDIVISKFLYYSLIIQENTLKSKVRKAGIPTLDSLVILKIQIPIPPLPIQQEIVSILDKFTQLEAELEAELEARRAQYDYYKNELLNFEGKEVEWKTLGEVGQFVRGNGMPKSDFTESGVGCIHYGQIYTFYGTYTDKTKSFVSHETAKKLQKVQKNDLIITNTSENIEDVCKTVVWLGNDEIVTGGHASIFKHNENPKYLAYYTQTQFFFDEKKKHAKGTKVIDVSAKDLAKIRVPIPPLAEQERIVGVLDKFDKLVNDISEGLPAEIKARRKQYEYYRGKLLSFNPLNINH